MGEDGARPGEAARRERAGMGCGGFRLQRLDNIDEARAAAREILAGA